MTRLGGPNADEQRLVEVTSAFLEIGSVRAGTADEYARALTVRSQRSCSKPSSLGL